jgi:hypothetical protein
MNGRGMNEIIAIISVTLGIINIIGLIYTVGWRLGRYELKVDTLWKYVVEAALVDSRQRGVVVSNSPVKVSSEVNGHFGELGERIKQYYTHHLSGLSDNEIVWQIYLNFDREIVEKVCLPYGLNLGQALIAALHICKGEVQTQ